MNLSDIKKDVEFGQALVAVQIIYNNFSQAAATINGLKKLPSLTAEQKLIVDGFNPIIDELVSSLEAFKKLIK